jgi:hypothetical protein
MKHKICTIKQRENTHMTENDLHRLQIDVEMTKPEQIEDLLGS